MLVKILIINIIYYLLFQTLINLKKNNILYNNIFQIKLKNKMNKF